MYRLQLKTTASPERTLLAAHLQPTLFCHGDEANQFESLIRQIENIAEHRDMRRWPWNIQRSNTGVEVPCAAC